MSDGWQSGAFSVSVDMSANEAAGINIVSSAFSEQMDVVVAGINNCLTKDGQNVPTSALPMGGYRHTGVGKAQAVDEYLRVNEFIHMSPLYMVDNAGGGSLTISVTATPWPASTSAGMRVVLLHGARSRPSASANNIVFKINGLSANCSAADGSQLWPGAFTSSGMHELIHDGSNFRLMNPGYRIVGQQLTAKARTAGNAVVTASGTVSVSCEMWRDGNTAHVNMAQAGRLQLRWQTSTATAIYLSVLPSWMRPTITTRYRSQNYYASTSTMRFGAVNVSTNGRIIFQNAGDNFDTDCVIFPFDITYPVK